MCTCQIKGLEVSHPIICWLLLLNPIASSPCEIDWIEVWELFFTGSERASYPDSALTFCRRINMKYLQCTLCRLQFCVCVRVCVYLCLHAKGGVFHVVQLWLLLPTERLIICGNKLSEDCESRHQFIYWLSITVSWAVIYASAKLFLEAE